MLKMLMTMTRRIRLDIWFMRWPLRIGPIRSNACLNRSGSGWNRKVVTLAHLARRPQCSQITVQHGST